MDSDSAASGSSESRSRASTIFIGSSESVTPAPSVYDIKTPMSKSSPRPTISSATLISAKPDPQSQGSNVDEFTPYQMLMDSEITIEYGKQAKSKRVFHEGILCCHSKWAQRLFNKGKALRQSYASANSLRKSLKSYIYPQMEMTFFEERHQEEKVIPFIVKAYEEYPIQTLQAMIKTRIDELIAEQVAKRNVTAPQTKSALSKKDLKGMGIRLKLDGLTSRAIRMVAQGLFKKLHEIKIREIEAAKVDELKAAAQGRIIVPGVQERVIKSFQHWIYSQGILNYEDAEHLYALQALATRLQVEQLSEQCLIKLSSEAEDHIQDAFSRGLTLQHLLGTSDGADNRMTETITPEINVVQVVFQHALKDPEPPQRLVKLVIDTLADHLDSNLWGDLTNMISAPMALKLIEAILKRRQVKHEESASTSMALTTIDRGGARPRWTADRH